MNKQNWLRKWALAIGIAIIFNLFVNYGVATFYKEPKWEDFCPRYGPTPVRLDNQSPADYNKEAQKFDEKQQACSKAFEGVKAVYDGNVFIVLVVIGVLAVLLGIYTKVEAVSTGFLFGGILSVIIGSIRNWSHLTDVWKFILLGLVLAMLVWIGLKKFRD